MEDIHTVKEVAEILQKSEETVKRWLRSGRFPNAYKKTDKQGWQIPQQDLQAVNHQKVKIKRRTMNCLPQHRMNSPEN